MLRRPGRFFGATVSPTSTAASGIWAFRDVLPAMASSTWPLVGPGTPSTPTAGRCVSPTLSASWTAFPGAYQYTLQWRSRANGSGTYSSSTSITGLTGTSLSSVTTMSTGYYYSVSLQVVFADTSTTAFSAWSNEVTPLEALVVPAPTLAIVGTFHDQVRATSSSSISSADYSLSSIDMELYASSDGVSYGLDTPINGASPGATITVPQDFAHYRARQRFNYTIPGCGASVATSAWSSYTTI
jgi:hypothetical protein